MFKTKDVFNIFLKLSFILFIFIVLFVAILFSENTSFNDKLLLLEKDYLTQKSLFEKYFLDFPEINFSIDDDNISYRYQEIIEAYSSLPKLIVSSFHNSNKLISLESTEYSLDNNSSKIIKEYRYLTVIFSDNDFKEYILINVSLLDKDAYFIDFVKEEDILRSNNLIKTKEIDGDRYLFYDENIDYLISFNNKYYDFKPVQLFNLETDLILEVSFQKQPNYVFYFFITIFCLFLSYSLFYYKEGKLFFIVTKFLKEEIIKLYNSLKKEIKKRLKEI